MGESGEDRGVERNRDQRFVKAPRWKSKNAVVIRVKITFLVKILKKGSLFVGRTFSLKSVSSGGGLQAPISIGSVEFNIEYPADVE